MTRISDCNSAERLDPFGDLVDQLDLLAGVFVQQEMELVESRSAHEPMMFLVERVQDLRVREDLVQAPAGQQSGIIGKPQGKLTHGAEALDLLTALMNPRLAASADVFRKCLSLGRGHLLSCRLSRAQSLPTARSRSLGQRINAGRRPSFHSSEAVRHRPPRRVGRTCRGFASSGFATVT